MHRCLRMVFALVVTGITLAPPPARPAPANAFHRPGPAPAAGAFGAAAGAGVASADGGGQRTDEFLEHYAVTNRFRSGRPQSIRVTRDGRTILFLRSGPRDLARDLYELDVKSGRERLLLRSADLLGGKAEMLTREEKARRERQRLIARGFSAFDLSPDGRQLLIPLNGSLFLFDRRTRRTHEIRSGAGAPIDPRFAPDGMRAACVRDGDIYLIDLTTFAEQRLTFGADRNVSHGLSEFVAQEEMDRDRGYWWSPDSRWIAFQETDTSPVERLKIVDPMHPETDAAAWPYPRPGGANAKVRLGVISVTRGAVEWIDWDGSSRGSAGPSRSGSAAGSASPDGATFEYLAAVDWSENAPLTILVQNREQTRERLLAVDVSTGTTTPLLEETDAAWINLHARMPVWLADGRGFLWTTERNGGPELELHSRNGAFVARISPPGFQSFEHYFPAGDRVIVAASTDPTESHLYSVSLDPAGPAPVALTADDAVHAVVTPDAGPVYVCTSESERGETRYEIADPAGPTGRLVTSVAEVPGFTPKLEFTTVGERAFNAVIVRPAAFDSTRRYPVIVNVYGGPHSQMVRRQPSAYFLAQWMADQGYVVVSLDGRGTPNRGRDWERATKGNLIDIPLQDQAEGLRELFRTHREMDSTNVGIFGWSFGGYFSAMAVMQRPAIFKAGIAGAPVTDWLDYDTHYTERYMGLPASNPDGYAAASVLTHAASLTRPLLLIHGTADDNVYFLHSLKLADALFRAGRNFEFLPLANFTHMVPDPLVMQRLYGRIMQFFGENLGKEQAG